MIATEHVRWALVTFILAAIVRYSSASTPTSRPTPHSAEPQVPLSPNSPAFRNVKVLNNLCWELLDRPVEDVEQVCDFSLPVDRWVWIRTRAEVVSDNEARLFVDSEPWPSVIHRLTGEIETMRYLKAGKHTLRCGRSPYTFGSGRITHLTVRAIPALQYAYYASHYSAIAPFGPYDWEFMSRHVLPSVNVMLMGGADYYIPTPTEIAAWKASGRQWLGRGSGIWNVNPDEPVEVDRAYRSWSSAYGVTHPLLEGLLVDEIGEHNAHYDVYREAAQRLYADPGFRGRTLSIYAYGDDVRLKPAGQQLARLIGEHGGHIAIEWYYHEYPDLKTTRQQIDEGLVAKMREWTKVIPPNWIIAVLTCATQPTQNTNRCPQTNVKVFMDMQMRTLATDPAFFGLGGVQQYHVGYSDEETVRWIGRLYRHYGIEGRTEPLTDDPYELPHVRNPDFENGLAEWTVQPAEPGSVTGKEYKGYGVLQGRWGIPFGDTFLWMKRSGERPNVVSQKVVKLAPGRLYSMKMLTSDYQDLLAGKSDKKSNAVSIKIDNVELLSGPKMSFQFTYPHSYGAKWDKFDPQHQYWVNYHWRVFRAKAESATLTVSDWEGETKPGGPIGQETMLNFVEIQPYLEP